MILSQCDGNYDIDKNMKYGNSEVKKVSFYFTYDIIIIIIIIEVKNSPANAGAIRDAGLIPGWGRSPGEGHGNPLQ